MSPHPPERYVGIAHCQPGLHAVVRETLKRSGYSASETAYDRVVIYDAAPTAGGAAGARAFLGALEGEACAVILCHDADALDAGVRTHPRVERLLVKPFSPRQLRELLDAVHAEWDTLTGAGNSPYETPTRELYDLPLPDGAVAGEGRTQRVRDDVPTVPDRDPAELTTADVATQENPLGVDAGIWLSLATELAKMMPTWSALPTIGDQAEAIAEWLEARLDD